MFDEFRELGLVSKGATDNYLRRLWRHLYWHVFIKLYMPFARCDSCLHFRAQYLKVPRTDKEGRAAVRREQKVHQDLIQLGRKRLAVREYLARRFARLFGHIYDDAMDNTKVNTPHTRCYTTSKSVSEKGEPLKTKMVGVWATNTGYGGYWIIPRMATGANVHLHALLHFIQRWQAERRALPQVLFVQEDNCGRDNKNHASLCFWGWLVRSKVFLEVQLHFLPVGK